MSIASPLHYCFGIGCKRGWKSSSFSFISYWCPASTVILSAPWPAAPRVLILMPGCCCCAAVAAECNCMVEVGRGESEWEPRRMQLAAESYVHCTWHSRSMQLAAQSYVHCTWHSRRMQLGAQSYMYTIHDTVAACSWEHSLICTLYMTQSSHAAGSTVLYVHYTWHSRRMQLGAVLYVHYTWHSRRMSCGLRLQYTQNIYYFMTQMNASINTYIPNDLCRNLVSGIYHHGYIYCKLIYENISRFFTMIVVVVCTLYNNITV